MIINITKENYDAEIINSEKPVLLEFSAPWCIPCKQITKIIEEIDTEQDAVKIAKLDIEEYPLLAAKNGITSIPALIFFKNGKAVDRIMGVKSKSAVVAMINK